MKRHIRYFILLLILLFVAVNEAVIRFHSTSWDLSLPVVIYVGNGDARQTTEAYIDSLSERDFAAIENFVNREARRYGLKRDGMSRLNGANDDQRRQAIGQDMAEQDAAVAEIEASSGFDIFLLPLDQG